MAISPTPVSIPLTNWSNLVGASCTTIRAKAGSAPAQLSNKPPLSPNTLTSPPVVPSSNKSNLGLAPPAQHTANSPVVVASRSRSRLILELVTLTFTIFATIWVLGTAVPLLNLAKWTARNDYLQSCIASLGVVEAQTDQCNKTITSGPKPPPYWKRDEPHAYVRWNRFGFTSLGDVVVWIENGIIFTIIFIIWQIFRNMFDDMLDRLHERGSKALVVLWIVVLYTINRVHWFFPIALSGLMYACLEVLRDLSPRNRTDA